MIITIDGREIEILEVDPIWNKYVHDIESVQVFWARYVDTGIELTDQEIDDLNKNPDVIHEITEQERMDL